MNRFTNRRRSRSRYLALFVGLAALCGLGLPSAASAYTHVDQCDNRTQGQKCYDTSGITFNPWVSIAGTTLGSSVSETCAKIQNSSGAMQPTYYCGGGNYQHGPVPSSPKTQVYGYWGSGGGTHDFEVRGTT